MSLSPSHKARESRMLSCPWVSCYKHNNNRLKSWFGFKIFFCTCIFKAVEFILFFKSGHFCLQKHGQKIQKDGFLRNKIGDPSFLWSSVLTLHNIWSRMSGKQSPKTEVQVLCCPFLVFHPKSYIILVLICIIYLYNGTGPWVNNSQAFIFTWCHKHLTIVSPANTLDLIFVIVYCCKGGENK